MIQGNNPGQLVQEKCLRLISCLQNKGYTYDQCIRALANTGYTSLRRALFWLCLHSNDALLMVDVLQEFFVVFCVDGEFGERLEEFRQEALNIVSLESSLDHPTCVEVLRFEAPPAAVPKIYKFFYNNAQFLQSRLKRTSLDLNSSTTKEPNSVGLNFTDPGTKTILHEFSAMLVSDLIRNCPDVAILPEPQRTYPCTDLAVVHAFVSEQFAALCQLYDTLVADIENNQTPDWSIRLYSRDPRLRIPDPQVYEMLTTLEAELVTSDERISNSNGTGSGSIGPCISAMISDEVDCKPVPSTDKSQLFFSNPTVSELSSGICQTNPDALYHLKHASEIGLLSYTQGDHVLLVGSCCPPGRQGCPLGVNLSTGATGIFNLCTGRRVPQYHTWVLHSSVPIIGKRIHSGCAEESVLKPTNDEMPSTYGCPVLSPTICDEDDPSSHHPSCDSPQCGSQDLRNRKDTSLRTTTERHPSSTSSSSSCPTNSKPVNLQSSAVAPSIGQPGCITGLTSMRNSLLLLPHPCSPSSLSHPANGDVAMSGSIIQSRQNSPNWPSSKSRVSVYFRPVNGSTKGRQLFVMRHAERVDICFGRGWVTRYFDKKGVYRRLNLNLPTWLPPRADYLDYVLDSPITQVGLFVAAETGRALAEAGVQFTVCYSSPSLRCVQTACELLRAMGRPELLVRIEPHLFEWFGWYGNCAPRMMNLHDLRACGYQVDVTYRALSSSSDFDPEETISNYYERTGGLTKRILSQHKSKDACILIVAHASSLDTCTHQLVHHGFRTCISSTEFHHRTSGVPYCGLVVAQENRRWSLVNPPIPNVCSHTPNPDFDWRQLLSPTLCGFPIK